MWVGYRPPDREGSKGAVLLLVPGKKVGCDFVWEQGRALDRVVYELRWPRAVLE